MPKYVIELDDSLARAAADLAGAGQMTVPDWICGLVADAVKQRESETLTEEFKRLVEVSITENEPVLRRFAR